MDKRSLRQHFNVWKSHFAGTGIDEELLPPLAYFTRNTICQTILRDSGILTLLEEVLNPLQIGIYLQYDSQEDSSDKVFYVAECSYVTRILISSFG